MTNDPQKLAIPSDRYLMPWVIEAFDDGPTKNCVLVASMDGHEMLSISLHVANTPARDGHTAS